MLPWFLLPFTCFREYRSYSSYIPARHQKTNKKVHPPQWWYRYIVYRNGRWNYPPNCKSIVGCRRRRRRHYQWYYESPIRRRRPRMMLLQQQQRRRLWNSFLFLKFHNGCIIRSKYHLPSPLVDIIIVILLFRIIIMIIVIVIRPQHSK